MNKLKSIKTGLALTVLSLAGGGLYFNLLSSQQLTLIKLSNILFIEFLVFFSLGNLLYFKNKFWNRRPWEQKETEKEEQAEEKEEEDQLDELNPEGKGRNLMLISLPLLVVSILITLF